MQIKLQLPVICVKTINVIKYVSDKTCCFTSNFQNLFLLIETVIIFFLKGIQIP